MTLGPFYTIKNVAIGWVALRWFVRESVEEGSNVFNPVSHGSCK